MKLITGGTSEVLPLGFQHPHKVTPSVLSTKTWQKESLTTPVAATSAFSVSEGSCGSVKEEQLIGEHLHYFAKCSQRCGTRPALLWKQAFAYRKRDQGRGFGLGA